MNYKVMGRFISKILAVEAVFMTPAMLISVFDKEYKAFISFVLSILIIMAVSALLFVLGRKAKQRFFVKEGLACVGLSWIAISLLGCLLLYIREIYILLMRYLKWYQVYHYRFFNSS